MKWLVVMVLFALMVSFSKHIYHGIIYGAYILDAKLNKPEGTCRDQAFSIEKAGSKVSCDLAISKDASYKLQLIFAAPINNREERKRVSAIVSPEVLGSDGQKSKSGAPLELYVLIQSETGQKIHESKVVSPICNSWGADSIFMDFDHVDLTSGRYKVTVESLKDAPEFKAISSRFQIGLYNPK